MTAPPGVVSWSHAVNEPSRASASSMGGRRRDGGRQLVHREDHPHLFAQTVPPVSPTRGQGWAQLHHGAAIEREVLHDEAPRVDQVRVGSRHDDIEVGGPTGRTGPGYADPPHDIAVDCLLVELGDLPVSRRREERRGERTVYGAVLPALESV